MNILIPVSNNELKRTKISSLDELNYWLFLDISEGKVVSSNFFKTKEEIKDIIDVVVVKSQNEYVWPFIEEQIAVLVAPIQRDIADIIEAYLFKELHEIN